MQRIIIKNFGPIEEVDLEIKNFIVLIGSQASGKSTIAKAIHFFKSITDELTRFFIDSLKIISFYQFPQNLPEKLRLKFLDYFGSQNGSEFFIQYFYSEKIWMEIKLEKESQVIEINFSKDLETFINVTTLQTLIWARELGKDTTFHFLEKELMVYLEETIHSSLNIEQAIFIPARRSLVSILSDQLQSLNLEYIDFLMRKFLKRIRSIRSTFTKSLPEIVKEFQESAKVSVDNQKTELAIQIINRILKGEYRYDRDGGRIFHSEQKHANINFSSSGQQEVLWFSLILFLVILEQKNSFIVIEEPEAHLFPETQKEISNLIALASNVQNSQVIITTHSPYILASFNNLIFAHKQGSKDPQFVNQRIPQELWLDKNKVFAGYVDKGRVEDFMDEELGLIQQEKLDSISSVINEEFDFLFQMEE